MFLFWNQENSALCDQVSHIQEKILCVKEERRFLLKKLIEYDKDILLLDVKPTAELLCNGVELASVVGASEMPVTSSHQTPPAKTRKPYKKRDPNSKKTKKSHKKGSKQKKVKVKPEPEMMSTDEPTAANMGNSLSVYELGEIVVDRIGYHTENWVYPVGFVSTRIYAHMLDPGRKCVYTCKITDGGEYPVLV